MVLEPGVSVLDGGHGIVYELADLGLLGVRLEMLPARFSRNPEDVLGEIFILVLQHLVAHGGLLDVPFALGVGGLAVKFAASLLEGVGDVLEEDEAQDDVFVFGSVHVIAQLVCCLPHLLFEA